MIPLFCKKLQKILATSYFHFYKCKQLLQFSNVNSYFIYIWKKKLFTFERKFDLHLKETFSFTFVRNIFIYICKKHFHLHLKEAMKKGALAPKLLGRILGRCSRLFRIRLSLAPLALRSPLL